MRIVPFLISTVVAGGLVVALNNKIGKIPPLGKLLSPQQGFWKNAEKKDATFDVNISGAPVSAETNVYLDDRLVPHIFAPTDNDAFFVQGYLHAKFRLWQMEFQTYAAAGRLCEILGEKSGDISILERADRRFRRMGMVYAAENGLKALENYPETKKAIDSYTAGVNFYINKLKPADYPIEYKILDYAPEQWKPLKTMLFLKYMALDLSADFDDFETTTVLQHLGIADFEKVYPIQPDSLDPISPKGTQYSTAKELSKMPTTIDSLYINDSVLLAANKLNRPNKNNGSNNWIAGGTKTASGRPILCNDPHLGLNLPSLWYELQISTPNQNVYGVSFPGAPGVVIGFNDSIAWGVTNAMRDVMDFYEVQFKDSTMSEYMYNGQWVKTTFRNETIRIRGRADYVDKLPMTVWGPVMYDRTYASRRKDNKAYAIRWTAHDPSVEIETFLKLDKAKNYNDYYDAIKTFVCPGQNFIFASKTNTIAWWQQAKFPAKWRRQGDFVMPGWDSTYAWQGYIPQTDNVHMINPERGFISSANQLPADSSYPFYIGGIHDVYRGKIINRLLAGMSNITVGDMKNLQTNNYNIFAEIVKPVFLKYVNENELNANAKTLLADFKKWDNTARAEGNGQTIFSNWWSKFEDNVWLDNLIPKDSLPIFWPNDASLIDNILKDTSFKFIDDKNTPAKESLSNLITASLNTVANELVLSGRNLNWAKYKDTYIKHLLSLPEFNSLHLPIGGGEKIINATTSNHGPSWRMIVELTDTTKAYGVYPGGQSGNPGSPYYDNFVMQWAKGEYNELWVMKPEEKTSNKVKWTMHFSNNK